MVGGVIARLTAAADARRLPVVDLLQAQGTALLNAAYNKEYGAETTDQSAHNLM
jgi:hypothetical protein